MNAVSSAFQKLEGVPFFKVRLFSEMASREHVAFYMNWIKSYPKGRSGKLAWLPADTAVYTCLRRYLDKQPMLPQLERDGEALHAQVDG